MEKIKSISEAFSMQPKFINVSDESTWEFINDKPNAVKEIVLERITIGARCGDPVEELYYVGYNFDGKKIFQYIANAVNIHFYPKTISPIGLEVQHPILPDEKVFE